MLFGAECEAEYTRFKGYAGMRRVSYMVNTDTKMGPPGRPFVLIKAEIEKGRADKNVRKIRAKIRTWLNYNSEDKNQL